MQLDATFVMDCDGLCVGYDSADKVSQDYEAPAMFTGGSIRGVGVDLGKDS